VRRSNTVIAALMVHLGDADAMLCGLVGKFDSTWPTSRKCWATRPAPTASPP
jgi:phosphotransacetylase